MSKKKNPVVSQYVDEETGEVYEVRPTPYLDDNGHEVLSSRPVAMPIGFHRPPSLLEQMRAMVRREASLYAQSQGYETFDEAEDFDVDDDFDPSSPWETQFDPSSGREITRAEFNALRSGMPKDYVNKKLKKGGGGSPHDKQKAADSASSAQAPDLSEENGSNPES